MPKNFRGFINNLKINILEILLTLSVLSIPYFIVKAITGDPIIYICITGFSFILTSILAAIKDDRKKELKKLNELFQCPNSEDCGLFIRKYQLELYEAKNGVSKCPHCNVEIRTKLRAWTKYDSFIDDSTEAPLIDKYAVKDIKKSIYLCNELRQANEREQRYSDFRKKRLVSKTKETDWIRNIGVLQHQVEKVNKQQKTVDIAIQENNKE